MEQDEFWIEDLEKWEASDGDLEVVDQRPVEPRPPDAPDRPVQPYPPEDKPVCDPHKESRLSPVPHDYEAIGEEYGSLAEGGSYEILRCRVCGRVAYSCMAD